MADIVERLAGLFMAEPAAQRVMDKAADTITALRAENERLRATLRMWEDAVKIDVQMQGPQYAGVMYLKGREAWKATCAALEGK